MRLKLMLRRLALGIVTVLVVAACALWPISHYRTLVLDAGSMEQFWLFIVIKDGAINIMYASRDLPPLAGRSDRGMLAVRQVYKGALTNLATRRSLMNEVAGSQPWEERFSKSYERLLRNFDDLRSRAHSVIVAHSDANAVMGFFVAFDFTEAPEAIVRIPIWGISLFAILPLWRLFLYTRQRRRRTPLSCTVCLYRLDENTSGNCPECGTLIPDEQRRLIADSPSVCETK